MSTFRIILLTLLFSLLFTAPDLQAGSIPDVPGKCVANCGDGGGGSTYTPQVPAGPSPEELRRAHEEKDLREAADDANDKGVDRYNNKDWANAAKYFREALSYDPDNPDIRNNLRKAEEQIGKEQQPGTFAGDQLKSAEHHGQKAKVLSNEPASAEARKGFDTGGTYAGSLPTVNVDGSNPGKEPVIPKDKRTPAITKLEKERDALKKKRIDLDNRISLLSKKEPKTPQETVDLAKLKQDFSTVRNKEIFLNFKLNEELKKPVAKNK